MDLRWLVRIRWRLLGAWMWPTFVVLAAADGVIGHLLPPAGGAESVLGGIVLGLVLNLLCVIVLGPLFGRALRVRRSDLPVAIARNYAGTVCIVLVTVGFAVVGALHHPQITRDRATLRDAVVRAAAWIGDHAPARFRADAGSLDSYVLLAGSIYRECAAAHSGGPPRYFCVVVDERGGGSASIRPAGSESNETLARGTD
ncbi:MAG TPA: hypothetical protein VMF07_02730 [Solirubrobacteraceae bacterium]|nr:hypothetical protein [Solirubrobacteraceae bacterium]